MSLCDTLTHRPPGTISEFVYAQGYFSTDICTGVTSWLLLCGLEVRVYGTSPYAPTVLLLAGREDVI